MDTRKPGEDGTWAGQLGPVDMPPGPYVAAPRELPDRVPGWRADDAGGTRRRYLPVGGGEAAGITVELHHGGQPGLRGGNAATTDGKVYVEPTGPDGRPRGVVPFDGGFLVLVPEAGVTLVQAVELGNRLHDAAASPR